jgi:hypothetical protein
MHARKEKLARSRHWKTIDWDSTVFS